MSNGKSVQQQHADIEWRRWNDEDTYYPLRDDARAERETGRRRQYAVRWCIEAKQVRNALTDGQTAIARHVRTLYLQTLDKRRSNFEFVDGGRSHNENERRRLLRLSEKHQLAGFEAVAQQIPNGRRCFHGIVEGDSFAAIQTRCGVNWRGALDLLETVTRALELYHGFNETDAAISNSRGESAAR